MGNFVMSMPKGVGEKLKEMLSDEEEVVINIKGGWGQKMLGNTWFVATNERAIIFTKGLRHYDFRDWLLKDITSVDYETHLLGDELTIHAGGSIEEITFYKDVVKVSREAVKKLRDMIRETKNISQQTVLTEKSIPEQIEKLAELKEKGILTDDEFREKKKELLDRL
ncbi:MAG: hypothetical protein AEth_01892 [Candidatus Argoarchaeum ethanivorans]|uniref:YokE-like PH domain-containing protein n=1 Tax=Candidatus Argoarchaeum ethanivorans TaxID=2608793 RepID=A0A8B3S0Y6_9EURY|nr:MAG: hypothetical protein AEth_01892 [Candidatus Argoarchaeum ethanivorans]